MAYLNRDGYLEEAVRNHPLFPKSFGKKIKIPQHRRIFAEYLGRPLLDEEIIHHKNEIKTDNRISNLEITDRATHTIGHRRGVPHPPRSQLSIERYRAAQTGKKLSEDVRKKMSVAQYKRWAKEREVRCAG